ncbi:MAG: agmatine deiminase family protein [Balneolaceae bacterium]|nr:agmatine deiminase family protein [Balneolaceae bacterium]
MNLIEAPDLSTLKSFEGNPKEDGYYFPAEWDQHEATWLSWPHNTDTWPGKFKQIFPAYCEFIRVLSLSEKVRINVGSVELAKSAFTRIAQYGAELDNIYFHLNPTNDAWCRDHGPSFLVNKDPSKEKIIVDWGYNAWGGKYPPFDLDNEIPRKVAAQLGLQIADPGIIMEGGSVEFNGDGALMTSESCLLNPNRNPELSKEEIEQKLRDFYGVDEILWIRDGIAGDDTDGHIDDTVRFVDETMVITMVEENRDDENFEPLDKNLQLLKQMKIGGSTSSPTGSTSSPTGSTSSPTDSTSSPTGVSKGVINESRLTIVDIQMPEPLFHNGQRLPASYANFYISNEHVIVPIFNSKYDDQALSKIQDCFPTRKVIGIDSTHLVWGLGSFHCLSQQEPK